MANPKLTINQYGEHGQPRPTTMQDRQMDPVHAAGDAYIEALTTRHAAGGDDAPPVHQKAVEQTKAKYEKAINTRYPQLK